MTCDRCGRDRTEAQLVKSAYTGRRYCRADWAECDRIWRASQEATEKGKAAC